MADFHPKQDTKRFNVPENTGKIDSIVGVGRVTDIILDQSHPLFENQHDIGKIYYQLLYKVKKTKSSKSNPIAYPTNGNIKVYPILGECVFLISGPSRNLNEDSSASQTYYLSPFNIWNETHNNSFPDKTDYDNQVNKKPTLQEISNQGPSSDDIQYNYGGNQPFVEKTNINFLQPFAGDLIFEGRWNQSIRFGKTTFIDNSKFSTKGLWPGSGKTEGSPIVIITNNRAKNDSHSPSLEDINKDGSSFYFTSDQNIVVDGIEKFPTHKYSKSTAPVINNFYSNQGIVSSDRIILYSKKDYLLFYGLSGIALSSKKSIHLDANDIISLNGEKAIELGSEALQKGQPAVLSKNLINILSPLITSLNEFSIALAGMSTTPESAIPFIVACGKDLSLKCQTLSSNLEGIKSEKVFLI